MVNSKGREVRAYAKVVMVATVARLRRLVVVDSPSMVLLQTCATCAERIFKDSWCSNLSNCRNTYAVQSEDSCD